MLLMVIPLRQYGQTIKGDIIEIELPTISNPDFRYCLLSYIANDDNIMYVIDEQESSVLLSSANNLDSQQFQTYFDNIRSLAEADFNTYTHADKEVRGTIFTQWKESLPQDLFVLLFRQILIENPNNRDNNQTCATADPFCTTDVVTFYIDASVSGSCEPGPDYGCMSPYTSRPPYWFYMKIGVAGTFTIQITNSNNNDLDFCAWGPFSDPVTPCTSQLTSNKIIDCDSPYNSVQECTIPASSQVGQYYLMVITRYSSGSTTVSFSKVPGSGPGETDCGILPPTVSNDGPYCVGETIHLTARSQTGATYSWTGPGGFTSNQQNPSRPNCTLNMAGTYTCTITVGGQSSSATTDVVVYPQPNANFTFTTVCQGQPTQFTNTSTTNPSGQQITSYLWDFGGGQTSTQQNPSYTFPSAGNHQVTLTVSCGNGHCTSSKTQTVTVYTQPIANAGQDQTIAYGTSAQLSGSGGAGTFNFHWEPANMVVNANAQNTQTVNLTQDQTYTLTVTSPQGGCTSSDEVTIHISGSAMTVTAGPDISICQGGSGEIQVNAGGGTGNISYSWTPTTGLSNPNISNPIASPSQTTTYTCHVTDGQTSQNVSVTVTVNDVIVEDEYMTICPDAVYNWHGSPYTGVGTYQLDTVTDQGCDKTIYLHLDHYPSYDETSIDTAICFGESFNFFGTSYDYSIYNLPDTLYTSHGCDSIVRLNLTVWPENLMDTLPPVSRCPDDLPYVFNGVSIYEPDTYTFTLQDSHGCNKPVQFDFSVTPYSTINRTEYVGYYSDSVYHCYIPEVDTIITYYSGGTHIDTLPTAPCESIFTLDLKFLQIPDTTHIIDTACNLYIWEVNNVYVGTYEQSCEVPYSIPLYFDPSNPDTQVMYYDPSNPSAPPTPCTEDYKLHLTVYHKNLGGEDSFDGDEEETPCDSIPFNWFGETVYFTRDNTYYFPNNDYPNGQTTHGCDTLMKVTVTNMKYTPKPEKFGPSDGATAWFGIPEDPNVPDTAMCAAVVTNTEFFSFRYQFYVEEDGNSVWDTCIWNIDKLSWQIDPKLSSDHKSSTCWVYVADRNEDFVVLTATAKNKCREKTKKFYLKSSFLDVDESELAPAKVNIVPNPNNGQMHLDFENMQGRTAVKVFDMTGNQIDAFETTINSNRYNYDYNLKKHANGIYFFVISNNNRVLTKKVVIIH